MTDAEMVKKCASLMPTTGDGFDLLAWKFNDNKPNPFHWDQIFQNIASGAITFGDDVRAEFCRIFADEIAYVPPVDRNALCTTDGKPLNQSPEDKGQHANYIVLCDDERAKGFVRPVRDAYIHEKCGSLTTMGRALAETYARDPSFYGATFCCKCQAHFPVGLTGEFHWEDGSKVGT